MSNADFSQKIGGPVLESNNESNNSKASSPKRGVRFMALLTPKDIREHTFQTVRFKEGYDVDEVDDFLDQVTETVEALGKQAVASGQATQSLGPDVAGLNSKISELSAQVQSLQQENATLKSASEQAAGAGDQAAQAAQVAAAKLTEAEESNRGLR